MYFIIVPVILMLGGAILFFQIPYSPVRTQFYHLTAENTGPAAIGSEVFSEEDIRDLPLSVQRYFRYCGYLGTPKMAYMRAAFKDVDFVMSESRTIKIDYEQFNLAGQPVRYALISSSLFGVPFEGLDSFVNGAGSMKGRLAKVIPLFDQRGEAMDRACLVTWLAECLLVPNAALQDFVTWESVDNTHAKARISWGGISASGIFHFSESGELLEFHTGDRVAVDMDGRETRAEWSGLFREYRPVNGILQPKVLQSVWHYSEGDCLYFNRNEAEAVIRYQ